MKTAVLVASLLVGAPLIHGCGFERSAASPASATPFAAGGQWSDERGSAVSLDDFRGHPFVLTMFYTACTVRCPLTVAKLRVIDEALRKRHEDLPIVVVTLDFREDTPERLASFKKSHALPGHWHLLHGDAAHTKALAARLGERVSYDDAHIEHEVRFAIVGADGEIARVYQGWDFDADDAVSALP
jgi:protein SCO1/2